MIPVLQVGVMLYKNQSFPWRLLETGVIQFFYEETGEWKEVVTLVVKDNYAK